MRKGLVCLILALCSYPAWIAMMAVHESGHALGAWLSGGSVTRISLPVFGFSRTDLSSNPHPALVAWAGPVWGCVFPLIPWWITSRRWPRTRLALQLFAGFCLIINGAYIGVGWTTSTGDAGDMLRHGTPIWMMVAFGALACGGGILLWHRTGLAVRSDEDA